MPVGPGGSVQLDLASGRRTVAPSTRAAAAALALTCGLCVAEACRDSLRPVEYGEPAQYVLATPASYACGLWSPAAPRESVGLFDVYFGREDLGPSADEINRAIRAGGALVALFHVNGFRAILPTGAAPALGAMLVRSATDASKLYHEVFVRFLAGAADTALVVANRGRVLAVYTALAIIYASLPDSALPYVRADPRVAGVEPNGVACPAQEGDEPIVVLPRALAPGRPRSPATRGSP